MEELNKMTPEQSKALKIVQEIEAKAKETDETISDLEDALEDLAPPKRKEARLRLEYLKHFQLYLEVLGNRIETDFGIAYECVEESNYEHCPPHLPGIVYNTQQKTMVRCDGKARQDFKVTCKTQFGLSGQGGGILGHNTE